MAILSWAKKHLNWSLVIYPFAISILLMALSPIANISSGTYFTIMWVFLISIFAVVGWVLWQKGRSLAWLLLCFIGIGSLVILFLENKRTKTELG